jgi:hypothetical protein
MMFETTKEVLDWYERQTRSLTKEFIDNIPWHEVKDHPLDPRFVPVLLYMRDVEKFTEEYHNHMLKTPTGKDPYICKFMERWGVEECTHGDVLNRFLNEAGYPTEDKWYEHLKRDITIGYKANIWLITTITNIIGKKFTATHMSFGAINELCTAQSYRRMRDICPHPVLTKILNGIIREEAIHTTFYWSVARLELRKSDLAQRLARWVIDNTWVPVGQGLKSTKDARYTVKTLFEGEDGLERLDRNVTQRIRQLPGFDGLTTINNVLGEIVLAD